MTGMHQLVLIDLPKVRSVFTGAAAAAERTFLPRAGIVGLVEAPSVPLDLEPAGLDTELVAGGTFLDRPIRNAEVASARASRTDDLAILLPLLPGARAAFLDAGSCAGVATTNFEAPPRAISPFLPFVIRICRFVMLWKLEKGIDKNIQNDMRLHMQINDAIFSL